MSVNMSHVALYRFAQLCLHSAASCLGLPDSSCMRVSVIPKNTSDKGNAYVVVRLLLVIVLLAQVILILIVVIVKVGTLEVIIRELLEGESLTGEPVDSTGNKLLLDVLTELIVELKTLLDVGLGILVIVIGGSLGR